MITLALEMAAPEGSVTCPRRTPEAVCANDVLSDTKNKNATAKKRMYFLIFTFSFLASSEQVRACSRLKARPTILLLRYA